MWDTAGEARTNSQMTFFYGPLHMDMLVLADQQERTNKSYVRTEYVVRKTYRER